MEAHRELANTAMTEDPRNPSLPHRVQRKRTKGWTMPPNTVYVGRPSKWGNELRVGRDGTAEDCVELYRQMVNGNLWTFPTKQDIQSELRGKNLACWCPILSHGLYVPCHGDVLLSLANDIPVDEVINENTRRAQGQTV